MPTDTVPLDMQVHSERQQPGYVEKKLWDHMRAVDLLQGLPEVNSEHIGATGHSLGGRSTHYLAALDERIGCAIISCGIIPFAGYVHLFLRRNQYDPLPTVRDYIQKHNSLPFEKHEITALIAPRPLMLVSPANDGPCPRTDQISAMAHKVFEVYRLLGQDKNLARILHGDGHDTTPYMREVMYGWFDLHLRGLAPQHGGA